MNLTFFDYIGVADMERIHSSTIAWIVSDSCKALSVAARTKILNVLFGTEKNNIKSIEATTEYKHIDVVFTTTDTDGIKERWLLENKIKASLRKNQLEEYTKEINKELDFGQIKSNAKSTILSLLGIFPQDQTGNWHLANYRQLAEVLKAVCEDSKEENKNQLVIIEEYQECLTNLESALSEFINNPNKYPKVFTDGDKTKAEKCGQEYKDEIMNYISKNSLETLFQKLYFTDILAQIKPLVITDFERCNVSETRGNADFGFNLGSCVVDPKYSFDISFQKGAFKFAVCKDNYPQLTGKTKGEIEIWYKVFQQIAEDPSFPNYTRINRPKKRKARISISYNIGSKWYEKNRREFADIVVKQIHEAKLMVKRATEYRASIDKKK